MKLYGSNSEFYSVINNWLRSEFGSFSGSSDVFEMKVLSFIGYVKCYSAIYDSDNPDWYPDEYWFKLGLNRGYGYLSDKFPDFDVSKYFNLFIDTTD